MVIGHFCGAWTTGFASFWWVMWYMPGKCPIPSHLYGYALMRSSLVFSCCRLVRSFLYLLVFCCGFLLGELLPTKMYFTVRVPQFLVLNMMGVLRLLVLVYSAMYHQVCSRLVTSFPSGSQSIACPTFHTVWWWINCRLSGKSWLAWVLLEFHQWSHVSGTVYWMHAVA